MALLLISMVAKATYDFKYFIYTVTEYQQGPWKHMPLTEKYDMKFLNATPFEDNFGSPTESSVINFLNRLSQTSKQDYSAVNYEVEGDIIKFEVSEGNPLIKQELIATFLLNNFNELFINGKAVSLADIHLPYMDLVEGNKEVKTAYDNPEELKDEEGIRIVPDLPKKIEDAKAEKNPYKWVSLILGSFLILVILHGWKD